MAQKVNEKDKTLGYLDAPPPNAKNELSYLSADEVDKVPTEFFTKIERPKRQGVGGALWQMAKDNPLVPIGMGTVIFAFLNGVRNMRNPVVTYKMMRLRVAAQGLTFVALVGVPLYKGYFIHKEKKLKELMLQQEQSEQAQPPVPEPDSKQTET